jgi:manganese/zinc/iron transport system substrate-binding protein
MDPSLWRAAITRAVKVLEKLDVDGAPIFRTNAKAYFKRLEALVTYSSKSLDSIPAGARVLVTAHGAFGYFGRRFTLEVLGIQGISTESEAGLQKIEGMVDILVQRQVPAVFVETSVSDRNVQALIEGADARDHRVLLGGRLFFVGAFAITGTIEAFTMMFGALIAVLLIEIIRRLGRLEPGAAMGTVFTVMFAIGVGMLE